MDMTKLENERKKAMKTCIIGIVAAIFLAILGIVFVMLVNEIAGMIFIVLGIFAGALCYSLASKSKNKIKNVIISFLLTKHNIGNDYHSNHILSYFSDILHLGLLKYPDRSSGTDCYSGNYKGIRFETSNLLLQERIETRRDGKTQVSYQTYFNGKVLVFDLPTFSNQLYMKEKGSSVRINTNLEQVDTELIEFNERYKIYTNDEIKTFRYLTPVLLQELLTIEKTIRGNFCYIFLNSKLYLFIENTNLYLNINLFKPLNEQEIKDLEYCLTLPLNLIDNLQLGKKTL